MQLKAIYDSFGIDQKIIRLCEEGEAELAGRFRETDSICEANQLKVIKAFQDQKASEACLLGTTGYGYSDIGRDTLEAIYAQVFGTEDALVRSQIICGTHALTVALFGNTRPGDGIFSPVGLPYDTLQEVIGIRPSTGSLAEYGVSFDHCELLPDGSFDYDGIRKHIRPNTRLIEIQRSRGYTLRHSLSVDEIGELIRFIRGLKDDLIIMVDNCYGEFVDLTEPSQLGADMVVGSLIKNPGGGIAPVGGYIAGTKECIRNAAARLAAPGLFKELGPSLEANRLLYQGLFNSPSVVAAAKKGAMLLSHVYGRLGFEVSPDAAEARDDIIQTVTFHDPAKVISFCKGVQNAAAIDRFLTPEPVPTPGYDSDIIMAAGCFISGSSIELSCDGPLREPYTVFFQGGLNYPHSKLGVMMSLKQLQDDGFIEL